MKNHARFHKCFMFDEGDGKGSPGENWIMLTITPAQYAPQPECRLSASQLKCLSIRIVWKVKNHAEKKNDFAWQRNWVVCMTYAGTQRKLKRCWMRKKVFILPGALLCKGESRESETWRKLMTQSYSELSIPFRFAALSTPTDIVLKVSRTE